MDNDTSANGGRFAPPQAVVDDIAADGLVLGGRGTRFLAAMIDGLLTLPLLWVIGKLFHYDLFSPPPDAGLVKPMLMTLGGGGVFVLMQSWLLAKHGQTIGKRLLGLRILRSDGSAASLGRLLGLRYGIGYVLAAIPFVNMLYSLIDCLLIFRESRQCLHDNIADTIVVKA